MLIFRYLAKEVFITLVALTIILLLIFMSNQLVQYLDRAANGRIPVMIVMKLMMLELPSLMGLLLPLGFYVSLLVAYGRLYAESEMVVLQACGYGPPQLLKHSFIMAILVSALVAFIVLWISPSVFTERGKLLRTAGIQTLIKTIIPGRFNAVSQGKDVFYVESMSRDHTKAKHVFIARQIFKDQHYQWNILWTERAFAETNLQTGEDYVVLQHGSAYEGLPGKADYQVAEFDQYKARLPHPKINDLREDVRTTSTTSLLKSSHDSKKIAEFQWRISAPLTVLILTGIAVPLSRVSPRAGKYAKLLPAIVLYIFYVNFMFVSRKWVDDGNVPVWLGMWWLHFIVFFFSVFLVKRNQAKLL